MDIQNKNKNTVGKNLGSVEPEYLATSFYLRSQGERSPWDMKLGSGADNDCEQMRAVASNEDLSGPCAPLVAQADSRFLLVNRANRWRFVCSSRARPFTAAITPCHADGVTKSALERDRRVELAVIEGGKP